MSNEERIMQVCLIAGDKLIDKFMHHADVFEKFKALAKVKILTLTLAPDAAPDEVIVHECREAAEEANMNVVACFRVGSNVGYVDPAIRMLSNGVNFEPLKQVLRRHGWTGPVEEFL